MKTTFALAKFVCIQPVVTLANHSLVPHTTTMTRVQKGLAVLAHDPLLAYILALHRVFNYLHIESLV
jgi:hypothetical protein